MTRFLSVPGLTRDLDQIHEAPDQVRGGVMVNTTLTSTRNPLKSLTLKSCPAWTQP